MDLACREQRPDEAAAVCAFTETIFGPMPLDHWLKEPGLTASVAFLGDELVGAIPLSLRRFRLAPGVVVGSAWENAVGTREDMRSRGVGTAMISAAREFLAGRCELLAVYRGGERSDGYRFYADKTHHVDLCYVAWCRLDQPEGRRGADVEVLGHEAAMARSAELARLFRSHWGACGGYAERDDACYQRLVDGMIFGRLPTRRRLHLLHEHGQPVAFALTGIREAHRADGLCTVYDFACADGCLRRADRLLDALQAYAAEEGLPLVWPSTVSSPLLPLLEAHGFAVGPRRMQIMARALDPAALFGTLAAARGGCDVTLDVTTPTVDHRLFDAGDGAPHARIELKDDMLCRLLASRLDGASALEEERLTIAGPAPRDRVREVLTRVLRCTPWVHPYVDWL